MKVYVLLIQNQKWYVDNVSKVCKVPPPKNFFSEAVFQSKFELQSHGEIDYLNSFSFSLELSFHS